MTKACAYCGKIHSPEYACPMCPKHTKKSTKITAFRSSSAWRKMREHIAERDLHLCRMCLNEGHYCTEIQVHHIEPLVINFGKRLDPDNLISLCSYHHERAESGEIPADFLRKIAASDMPPP